MYPVLFEFDPITVYSLWFFVALGFVVGALVLVNLAKRYRIRLTALTDHSFFLFLWTLFAARLTFILFHLDFFFYQFTLGKLIYLITIWDKGLSFWGAAIGFATGVLYLYRFTSKEQTLRLLDILVPATLFGMSLGNVGAFLEGINYGTPTGLPWGVVFKSSSVKYISPIHPAQMYGALYTLLIGIGLMFLLKKIQAKLPGFVAEIGGLAFSVSKFLEEFIRGDDATKIFGVRLAQLIAFAGICFFAHRLYLRHTAKKGGDPKHLLRRLFTHIYSFRSKKPPTPDAKLTAAATISPQNQIQ